MSETGSLVLNFRIIFQAMSPAYSDKQEKDLLGSKKTHCSQGQRKEIENEDSKIQKVTRCLCFYFTVLFSW